MTPSAVRLLLAAALVIGLTLVGGMLPLVREWSRGTIRMLLAFGTGVLLGAVFFHMLPEAMHGLGDTVGVAALSGFLLIYVLERFIMIHPCEEEGCSFHHMGLAAFLGITLHALIDGFALGAGLSVPHLSVAVTAAIVLHKLPASLSLSGILLHCEYPRRRIATMMILFSLATPIGAVISFYALRDLPGTALPFAIAFSAGTFLAIATADLLPQIHSAPDGRFRNLAALFLGLLVISLADNLVPGGHDHLQGGAPPAVGDVHDHSADGHEQPAGTPPDDSESAPDASG